MESEVIIRHTMVGLNDCRLKKQDKAGYDQLPLRSYLGNTHWAVQDCQFAGSNGTRGTLLNPSEVSIEIMREKDQMMETDWLPVDESEQQILYPTDYKTSSEEISSFPSLREDDTTHFYQKLLIADANFLDDLLHFQQTQQKQKLRNQYSQLSSGTHRQEDMKPPFSKQKDF